MSNQRRLVHHSLSLLILIGLTFYTNLQTVLAASPDAPPMSDAPLMASGVEPVSFLTRLQTLEQERQEDRISCKANRRSTKGPHELHSRWRKPE